MKRLTRLFVGLGLVLIVGFLSCGCGGGGVDQGSAERESGWPFLLDQEPAGALDVFELRETFEQVGGPEEVVLVGRIDGLSHPTWDPDRAAFMVADLSLHQDSGDHDGAPKHDADTCPFCKAKSKKESAGIALVEMVDASGAVPPVDARKLVGLAEGQVVVVCGHAKLDTLGTLVVQANKLFLRPEQ